MCAIDEKLGRCSLGFFPTPLGELKRLSRHLNGPRLWIKRDDLTGLALGGNKTRKLEFLLAEALASGCDAIVTAGATQSNHCRQTAAAAAALGIPCHLVLGGPPPSLANGNLLLDELFGATIHWTGTLRKGEELSTVKQSLCLRGLRPFVIPYGGSNPVGAAGFATAMVELQGQLAAAGVRPDAIVFASSSGGTHAGLLVGASAIGCPAKIIGIGIDKRQPGEEPFEAFIGNLANQSAELLGLQGRYHPEDVFLKTRYLGAGYGMVGALERDAIALMARFEGILLDPVYTGRAFGALVDLVRQGEFGPGQEVVFWHTGGSPALFAYAEALAGRRDEPDDFPSGQSQRTQDGR
ncbi:MAG TPA: D-cysteine desulfhydrase family protein [Terrimicrobiaceae bacterium]|nr:D-cysteine desulfhydrase family protein [Terrimicrobiaceae bacterium]